MAKGKKSKTSGSVGKKVSFGKIPSAPPAGSIRAPKVPDFPKSGLSAPSSGKGKDPKLPESKINVDDLINVFDYKPKAPKSGVNLDKVAKANKLKLK